MIGRMRSRRFGALLAGSVLFIALAGCSVGTSSIAAGQQVGLVECTAGTPGALWLPGPGARYLRFHVTRSDATQPLEAGVWRPPFAEWDEASFGTVWDGTKSTGLQQIPVPLAPYLPLVLVSKDGPVPQTIHADWEFTALDANGNDVGLTCTTG